MNGHIFRFDTFTPTISHSERDLKENAINDRFEFNILNGDMSIVGPRPLLMQYLDRYTPEQARRHEVKPGLTGWAKVNGRNTVTWEDKFKMDV